MKRNLLGALAVTSALTLWTSVAAFASPLDQAKAFAGTETTNVTRCETGTLAKLDGIATASSNAEATQEAKDTIAEAKDQVKDLALDARLDIASALADFKDATAEADEDEPGPSLDAFNSLISGIRKQACSEMDNVYTATQAEVKGILADAETIAAENDDHMTAAAEDEHLDREEPQREREREGDAAEQERD